MVSVPQPAHVMEDPMAYSRSPWRSRIRPHIVAVTVLAALWGLFPSPAQAEIQGREVHYRDGDVSLIGYLAWDDAVTTPRPGVLVVHEWWGHNHYARERARKLAKLGYTAFALDMYGTGKVADHPQDAERFMNALVGDMARARERFLAARRVLAADATVDARHIAAIGYCLGGGVVRHMAKAGIGDLAGVVSFHGALGLMDSAPDGPSNPPALVFTGGADPFVPADRVAAFSASMTRAGAPFTLVSYPGVQHSFTNPGADALGRRFNLPLVYDPAADRDSWTRMTRFLHRVLTPPNTEHTP